MNSDVSSDVSSDVDGGVGGTVTKSKRIDAVALRTVGAGTAVIPLRRSR